MAFEVGDTILVKHRGRYVKTFIEYKYVFQLIYNTEYLIKLCRITAYKEQDFTTTRIVLTEKTLQWQ